MGAMDNVRAHFARLAVPPIEVPEWGDQTAPEGDPARVLVIYSRPLTLAEKAKLMEIGEQFGRMNMLAHTLIIKATDKAGNALFSLEDKPALMKHCDPDVLSRVVTHITKIRTESEVGESSPPSPT